MSVCGSSVTSLMKKTEYDYLRENNGVYEYVAVYVDDLAIAMKNPQEFISVLENKYKFNL